MLKLFTCYQCGFPFKADDESLPPECPACGGSPAHFLSEPYNEQEIRRIHVDPPLPAQDRNPFDLEWHMPRTFPKDSHHGRMRRFVMEYDNAVQIKSFYKTVFGWDIINTEHTNPEKPLMFCATGPGTPNWEPRVVSFAYGFLKDRASVDTPVHPMFCIAVDNIDTTVKMVEENEGKLLKPTYEENGILYAVVQDSEGNGLYLMQTPSAAR